jgi:hypothetical protein
MNDWENEFFGLTNLTGMHDEEYEEEPLEQKKDGRKSAQPGKIIKSTSRKNFVRMDPGKNPLLHRLGQAQVFAEHALSKEWYRQLQYILIRSDYLTIKIEQIQAVQIQLLQGDFIGLVEGRGSDWSAYYLTVPGAVEVKRGGYRSSDQAVKHIIAIYKNRRR